MRKRRRSRPRRESPLAGTGVVAIALLGLLLGGATELWAQATVATAIGLLVFAAPPRCWPECVPALLTAALLLIALAAFLPAHLASLPDWRAHFVEKLQEPLPPTRTAQPWVTAQACGVLFIGSLWVLYALAFAWSDLSRERAVKLLVGGVGVLAAVAVYCFFTGARVPFWDQQENRGWFPNRNQTANVLALCGVLNYALMFDPVSIDRRRFWWLLALLPIGAGLVIAYSRAGIILFFAGICLWHLLVSSSRTMTARGGMALATALLLVSLLLLFGGETIDRFRGSTADEAAPADFRVSIQKDALRFSKTTPWLGVGLGNFGPLFARARHASAMANSAIHPESDWLWLAGEAGWPAVAIIGLGVIWWLRESWGRGALAVEPLRAAAVVCTLLFLLHGLVDVSGHRLGSFCVAAVLGALALPERETREARGAAMGFRTLALVLMAWAGWWFASIQGANVPPTSATLARMKAEIKHAADGPDYPAVEATASTALRIAPLDYHLYFHRAMAAAFLSRTVDAATDFKAARYLQPRWPALVLDEGVIWMAVGESKRCAKLWRAAIEKSSSADVETFKQMLAASRSDGIVRAALRTAAAEKREYLLPFLQNADAREAGTEISLFLLRDPQLDHLDGEERRAFFGAWSRSEPESLAREMATHPAWQKDGWNHWANHLAEEKDFRLAWELVERFAPRPPVPQLGAQELVELERDFFRHPTDPARGALLALAQSHERHDEEALVTLKKVRKLPDPPAYAAILEAELHARSERWEEAWHAWRFPSAR